MRRNILIVIVIPARKMATFRTNFFSIIVILYFLGFFEPVGGQLRAGGAHVCSRTVTYNAYESQQRSRIGYEYYRVCCRRAWGVCTNRCRKSRSTTVYYSTSVLVQRRRLQYYCCPGWARSGDECPKPICNPGCRNGKCTSPNDCTCNTGYNGNLCQHDIDECLTNPCPHMCTNLPGTYLCSCRVGYTKFPPNVPTAKSCNDVDECSTTSPCKCAQSHVKCNAACTNTRGSYRCSCSVGFKLTPSKVICTDNDECSSAVLNKCQHNCLNTMGGYICHCRPGYLLASDNFKCEDLNECLTLNGGCSQICTNRPGTYQCSCKRGFRLSNDKKTCVDINECTEQKPCDNRNGVCTNIRGSYQCLCKVGYKLFADKKTCKDIDECRERDRCQHNCTNNHGSYFCSCTVGFRLHTDQHRCDDVDECNEGTDKCQHRCHNTIGSYTCSCRNGYKLKSDDKSSCKAIPCQIISPPAFGKMKCSGYVTDESCNISCNTGFNLDGPKTRKCQPSTVWSGDEPKCERRSCPPLLPIENGQVVLPCIPLYQESCSKRCTDGFVLEGSSVSTCIVENEEMVWNKTDAACTAWSVCNPSPCLHNGICQDSEETLFQCNCDGTGYEGQRCSIGILTTPTFPELTLNEQSQEFTIYAKPEELLIIELFNIENQLKILPNKIIIAPPRTSGTFVLMPLQTGEFQIDYKLSGVDADFFIEPKSTIVKIMARKNTTVAVNVPINFYRQSCGFRRSMKGFNLTSTCSWTSNGSTAGFVTMTKDDVTLPVSIVGVSSSSRIAGNGGVTTSGSEDVTPSGGGDVATSADGREVTSADGRITTSGIDTFIESKNFETCPMACNVSDQGADFIDYIVKYKYFPIIFSHELSSMLPNWIEIYLWKNAEPFRAKDLFTNLIKGSNDLVQQCFPFNANVSEDTYYLLYQPNVPFLIKVLTATKRNKVWTESCFAVNINTMSTSLSLSQPFNFTSDIRAAGILSKNVRVTFFQFTPQNCSKLSDCELYEAIVDGTVQYDFKSFLGQLKLAGRFRNGNVNKLLMKKFDSNGLVNFEGSIKLNIDISFLGNTLKIKALDEFGEAMLMWNNGEGNIQIKIRLKEEMFQHSVSIIRFSPSTESVLTFPLSVNGGNITGMKKKAKLQGILNSLLKETNSSGPFQILKDVQPRTYSIFNEKQTQLHNETKALLELLLQSSIDYQKVIFMTSSIRLCIIDILAFLQAVHTQLPSQLMQINTAQVGFYQNIQTGLDVFPRSSQINFAEKNNWTVSYSGNVCVYSLCFKMLDVVMKNDQNKLTLKAVFTRSENITSRVQHNKGHHIAMVLDKRQEKFNATFTTNVTLFGKQYKAEFSLNERSFKMVALVTMPMGLNFAITSHGDVQRTSWQAILSIIEATSFENKILEKLLQEEYTKEALLAKRRLGRLFRNHQDAVAKISTYESRVNDTKTKVEEAMKKFKETETRYKKVLQNLANHQKQMQSYTQDNKHIFTEKNLTAVCSFKTCQHRCLTIPICRVCYDPMLIDIVLKKCKQTVEKIRFSVLVPFKTKCTVTQHSFVTKYTGTCKKHQISTTSVGGGLGGVVGIIPGILRATGDAIKGAARMIGNIFSSCTTTFEVTEHKETVEESCTLQRKEKKTVGRQTSTCFEEIKTVTSGFGPPRDCCVGSTCAVNITNNDCQIENKNCRKRRASFLKQATSIPKVVKDLAGTIQSEQQDVEQLAMWLQNYKIKKRFFQNEYKLHQKQYKNAQQHALFTGASETNARKLLSTELCLLRKYEQEKNITNLLKVNKINFKGTLPFVENIQMDAMIYNVLSGSLRTIPFIYNFQDVLLSLKSAAKKIVFTDICKRSGRSRRALTNVVSIPRQYFTSWYNQPNATSTEMACMTFKGTTRYLEFTIKSLVDITQKAVQRKRYIKESSSTENPTSADPASDSLAAFFKSLQVEFDTYANRSTVSYLLTQWKETSEMYTSRNNFTVCFGFEDCVESAFDSLAGLPTVLTVSRPQYEAKVAFLRLSWKMLTMSFNASLDVLLEDSLHISQQLSQFKTTSLHCARGPVFTNTSNEETVAIVGANVTLECGEVESLLPFTYQWKYNKNVLDGKDAQVLQFTTTVQRRGAYSCTASSRTGSAVKEHFVDVIQPPMFLSEVKDITYVTPRLTNNDATFTCNITSLPKASINWYYQNYAEEKIVLLDERTQLLNVNNKGFHSGFYFCVANNSYGEIASRKAKMNIVKATFSVLKLNMMVNVTSAIQNNTEQPLQNLDTSMFSELKETLLFAQNQMIQLEYKFVNDSAMLLVGVTIDNNVNATNGTFEDMFQTVLESRKNLARSAGAFVGLLLKNRSSLSMNYIVIGLDNTSLIYDLKFNICPVGYQIHKNGYMCVQCSAGFHSTTNATCVPCGTDAYQPLPGKFSCLPCHFTLTTNNRTTSTSERDCQEVICSAGSYNNNNGTCILCEENTYQPDAGKYSCLSCDPSKTTNQKRGGVRETACQEVICPAGSYNNKNGTCIICEKNTYQPDAGKYNCLSCDPTKTTNQKNGSTSETDCVIRKKIDTSDSDDTKFIIIISCSVGAVFLALLVMILCASARRRNTNGNIIQAKRTTSHENPYAEADDCGRYENAKEKNGNVKATNFPNVVYENYKAEEPVYEEVYDDVSKRSVNDSTIVNSDI